MNKQGAKYKLSPKGRKKLGYSSKTSKPNKLPLIGKTIYLDVKETKHLKQLNEDLKKLGATLEDFVSRDINYIITSQQRPKKKVSSQCASESPTPSPFNCDPSPSPGIKEDKKVTSVTRGKALLEKARCTRQASTLLDNAEKWGVKIVSIEGAFKWIEIELKKLPRSPRHLVKRNIKSKCVSSYKLLKAPYVKLETQNFCYRPFHSELDVWPRLNVDTPRGSCPFDGTLIKGGDESREERGELLAAQVDIPSEDTQQEENDGCESADNTTKALIDKSMKRSDSDVGGGRILTAGELKRRRELKKKQERKRGYCECCHVKYEDLDKHVKEEQHRQYVKTKTNYCQLDTLIQSGPNIQHFLYECLQKAAQIRNVMKNSESCVRSPRKKVTDSSCNIYSPQKQSVMSSPSKGNLLGNVDTPGAKGSIRGSPSKNPLEMKNDNKSVVVSKTPNIQKTCGTNGTRVDETPRKSDVDKGEISHKKTKNIKDENLYGSPRLRQSEGIHKVHNTENQTTNALHCKEICKDLSTVVENHKILSPRKQSDESLSLEIKVGNGDEVNKENISPCKSKVETTKKFKRKLSLIDEKLNCTDNEEEHDAKVSLSPIKCAEKTFQNTKDIVEKINVQSVESSDKDSLLEQLVNHDCKLIKTGFAEIVNFGKKRIEVEHSSDDFEVCLARSLEGPLPVSHVENEKAAEKTFDEVIKLCDKNSIRKSNKGNTGVDDVYKSYKQEMKNREKSFSKEVVKHSSKEKDTKENENRKDGKVKDVYDIDNDSDIPSDTQCHDDRGNVMTFSKTLAERIKERSVNRKSVDSYNVTALFRLPSRSRSISFSSNQSDKFNSKNHLAKLKKGMEKKKTRSCIAGSKVLHKYRNKRFGKVQNENIVNGYQGDDENEKTPDLKQVKHIQKKSRSRFWDYVPIAERKKSPKSKERLTGLLRELKELAAANSSFATDISDSDQQRSQMNSSKIRNDKFASEKVKNIKLNFNKEVRNCNTSFGKSVNVKQVNKASNKESRSKNNKFWYYLSEDKERYMDKNKQDNHFSMENEFSSTRRNRRAKNNTEVICDLLVEENKVQENGNLSIPNELIDSWNTGIISDRARRRKSNKTYIDIDTDTDFTSESDYLIEQTTQISEVKVTENENDMPKKETSCIKSKTSSKFWEYVPVVHCKTVEKRSNIPKILQDTWNTGDTIDRKDRRRTRNIEISSFNGDIGREIKSKNKEMESGSIVYDSQKVLKKVKSQKCKMSYFVSDISSETNLNDIEKCKEWKELKTIENSKDCVSNNDVSNTEFKKLGLRKKKTMNCYIINRGLRKRAERVNYNEGKSQQSSCQSDDSKEQQMQDTHIDNVQRLKLHSHDVDLVHVSYDEDFKKYRNLKVDKSGNDGSKSPVFKMSKNQKIEMGRRMSPIFKKSPWQLHDSDKNSASYNFSYVRSNNKDICLDSEGEAPVDKPETLIDATNFSFTSVKTPEKCSPVKESRSGFSLTPREERLKQWKRKNSDSECPEEKRRKVENQSVIRTPRRRLLQEHSEDVTTVPSVGENDKNLQKEMNKADCHVNGNDKFSVTWTPLDSGKSKGKCQKVKLNKNWSLMSEFSDSKLLSSEDDNVGHTNEFNLHSDMSNGEYSEAQIADEDEWVVEERKSEVENLVQYVPAFFPSPNKTSNSSWNDAVEGYIENSVKLKPNSSFKGESSSMYFSFNCSPRNGPSGQNSASQIEKSGKFSSPGRGRASTPKRKRISQKEDVEKVDAEIEFNFGSPHKDCSDFSPLRSVNGVVRNISRTPSKTSTPMLPNRKSKKSRKH